MKILIKNYAFDKTAKTVTFSDYQSITLENVLLITNVTKNEIIYNFADPTKGATVTNNIVNLTYDTSSMSNTDKLQIFYDDGLTGTTPTNVAGEQVNLAQDETLILLRRIARNLEPIAVQDSSNRQRVTIDAGTLPAVTTVTTVSAVTNMTSLANIDARYLFIDTARNAYANGIRSNLIFS